MQLAYIFDGLLCSRMTKFRQYLHKNKEEIRQFFAVERQNICKIGLISARVYIAGGAAKFSQKRPKINIFSAVVTPRSEPSKNLN